MINATKIRQTREKKGFLQEYIATKLNVSQPVYARMESGKKKMSIDQLYILAKELDEAVEDLLDSNHPFIQNGNNTFRDNSSINQTHHTNIYNVQKELYEEHLALLREEIGSMRKEREKLLEIIQAKLLG